MCGRFVASSPVWALTDQFDLDDVRTDALDPSWNVAPTDNVRVVVAREGVRTLETRRWGLVPHWAASPAEGAGMINARAETVHETPAFRHAFASRRCLIPADGFYEWKRRDGVSRPYLLRPADGRPLALAGLRGTWGAEELKTCAIVTTTANSTLAELHDRMPVILPRDVWPQWLDDAESDVGRLRSLLVPAPEDLLEIVPVGRGVNNARNDGPSLVERVPDAIQETLPF